MARGCAHQDREHRELRGGSPQPLGGEVWHSRRNHVRQRHPFHIKPMDGPVSAAGHRGAANDNVQPRSQRHGRAAPQDLESSTHDEVRYRQLGDQPAVGTAGPPNNAKRGDQRTAAEMTYGDNLQVPGDFFASPGRTSLQDIRHEVKKYVPCKPTYKSDRKIYVPPDLHKSGYLFLRIDSQRAPLTPPYIGPFAVQERKEKVFKIVIRDKPEWVSIDRLKPAYITADDQPESSSSQYSRAGRPLRKRPFH